MHLSTKNWHLQKTTNVSIVAFLLLQLLSSSFGLKCDNLVKETSPEILSYLGNVTFNAPGPSAGNWTLFMKTTAPFTFLGGWDVRVQSDGQGRLATFHNVEEIPIKKGDVISFRFRIHYAPTNNLQSTNRPKIPHVKSLQWEKFLICEGSSLNTLTRTPPTSASRFGKNERMRMRNRRKLSLVKL